MAIKDTSRKPFIEDNNTDIFIGLDLPVRKSEGKEGFFASTSTTIEAVKNNIRNLLNTERGERFFQPNLGIGLRRYLFQQITNDVTLQIQNEIVDTINAFLPFVEVQDIQVKTSNNDESVNVNTFSVNVLFNIKQSPNILESVEIAVSSVDGPAGGGSTTSAGGGGGY